MGVEPTAACSAQPATNFEDWGIHRDTTTPIHKFSVIILIWVLANHFPEAAQNLTSVRRLVESHLSLKGTCPFAGIAQLVEHCTENAGVPSSSLGPGTGNLLIWPWSSFARV
jgi:hypothetical protein